MSGNGWTPVGRLMVVAVVVGLLMSTAFAEKKQKSRKSSQEKSARQQDRKSFKNSPKKSSKRTDSPRYAGGVVTTEVLNVREKPASEGHRVLALVQGAEVKILAKKNGFYKIKTSKGAVGWVLWKYVRTKHPERVAALATEKKPKPQVARAEPPKPKASEPKPKSAIVVANKPAPAPALKPMVQTVALTKKSTPPAPKSTPASSADLSQTPNSTLVTMTQTPAAGEVVRVDPTTQLFLQTLDAKPSPKTATKLTKLAKIMTMPPLAARPLVKEEAPLLVAEWEKNQKGKALVDAAMGYRGTPYRRGASLPSRGFDCSGLVYHVLKTYGINSPRTAAELFGIGTQVVKSELREGDLVFFANTYKRGISHVGIYLGSGRFIHASSRGGQVTVNSLDEDYYAKHYAGARRVMKE